MAAPDAAILQEIARISGAINRAKAASQDASSSPSPSTSNGAPAVPASSSRGRPAYHQPPVYGHRGGHAHRGRGYPPSYASNGPFRGSHSAHYAPQSYSSRGKPRPHTVTRANNTWTAATAPSTSSDVGKSSKNKTLVLNHSSKDKSISPAAADPLPLPTTTRETSIEIIASTTSGESSTAAQDVENAPSASGSDEPNKEEKVTTSKQEEEDVDMEDGEIDESTLPPPEPKKPPISLIKQGNEIIINGVTFVSDSSGRKLVRKDSSSRLDIKGKGKALLDDNNTTSTPSKTSIDGQAYVRTKSGNLISTAVLKKRQEMAAKKKRINDLVAVAKNVQKARQASARAQRKKTLCRYFQKTGVCARANTCPYIHDSEKVSICPRFLRNSCPLTPSTCPLSHSPNAHRMPHCQHFPHCKRGDSCPYTHIQVSPDAKICKDFVGFGWCEKGDQCHDRHVWECPDFEEKGVCSKRGCKLGHVIRRKTGEEGSSKLAASQETPSFMFVDTNPDPSYVQDKSISLPSSSRKRTASDSIASTEEYSSGEEEAANLVKKKVKIIPVEKDEMQANEDFVTLVFSDMEGEDDDDEDDEESEVESGLEEDHLDSISRKRYPISYENENGETNNENQDSDDESDDVEDSNAADTTLKSAKKMNKATVQSVEDEESDDSDESGDSSASDN